MRLRLIGAVAACAVLPLGADGALSPAASASPAAAMANSVTFEDSRSELPNAPDITTVVVSNTDASAISFKLNIAGVTRLAQGMLIGIDIDADNNRATGSQDPLSPGADYAIQLFGGSADLFQWDGTNFSRSASSPPQTTLVFNELTIRINASELGNTKRFNFGTTVITGIVVDSNGEPDFTNASVDFAPDLGHGFWNYTVRIAPLRLVARRFSLTPGRPQAGRILMARLAVIRSDTGAAVRAGRVTCAASVAGRRIAGRGRFVGNEARCTWQVPSSARGRRITGSITVVFEGRRVSRSFAATVG
jgi:hypothetical protein